MEVSRTVTQQMLDGSDFDGWKLDGWREGKCGMVFLATHPTSGLIFEKNPYLDKLDINCLPKSGHGLVLIQWIAND